MNGTGAYRLVLPVGLLLLALCSTGLALKCYQCDQWTNQGCMKEQTCDAGQDTCMKANQTDVGLAYYKCVAYNKCTVADVKQEFGLSTSLSVSCCQNNLCNKGFTGLPGYGLILFLASALLILFS